MKKAFTLIELLIVIAIIGILATVVFVSLSSAKKKAQDSQVQSDLTAFSTALEVVKVDRPLRAVGWTTLVNNDTTPTENNIKTWRDDGTFVVGGSATGNPLITNLPTNPAAANGAYGIRVTAKGYALIGQLNGTNIYWCNNNGTGRKITGKAGTAANNECATGL